MTLLFTCASPSCQKVTVRNKFRESSSGDSTFRCIKPNDQLVPAKFNYARIAEQLRNAGVLEVVRVARAGFPVRLGKG